MAEKQDYLPYAPAPDPGAGPRPLHAILVDLARPIHENFLQEKKKGGQSITFVSWHGVTRILDRYAPGWQTRTRTSLSLDGLHVAVDLELGIPTSDYGMVWRASTGSDEDEPKAYGDATDRAESQALRRAASKFRLGLYLYYEKGANGPTQRNPQPAAQVVTEAPVQGTQTKPAPVAAQPTIPRRDWQRPADVSLDALMATFRTTAAQAGYATRDDQQAWLLTRFSVGKLKELSTDQWAAAIRELGGTWPPMANAEQGEAP